jgi:agmatine deiminase
MPPEWAPQSAIWLSWPSNPALWPGHFTEAVATFAQFAAAIARFEPVRINCAGALRGPALQSLREAKADLSVITLHEHPTNDVWCRDHGPIFVKNGTTGELAVTDWEFRGWGGKFEASLDNAIPRRIAETLGLRRFAFPFELEGGAVDANGDGCLLTTDAVLNNPNRAGGRDDAAFFDALRGALGVEKILWLGGGLANDDTDGHVDNIARFFSPNGIVASSSTDPGRPDHATICENLRRLRAMSDRHGKPFEVVELPLPEPFRMAGRDLPPSYANFLIVNGGILAPVYGQAGDSRALGILRELFPGRHVIGLDCRALLIEGGALHCLSQQQPA